MLFFSEAFSHPEGKLKEHLLAVAINGQKRIPVASLRVKTAIILMGLIHDAGKATPWFQQHLFGKGKKRDERTHHAKFGALLAHYILEGNGLLEKDSDWIHWTVVNSIIKHHGNLDQDIGTLFTNLRGHVGDSVAIRDQLGVFDGPGYFSWLKKALVKFNIRIEIKEYNPEKILGCMDTYFPKFKNPFKSREDGFDFLVAFGSFVGTDKMDAANLEHESASVDIPSSIVKDYKKTKFGIPDNDLDRMRDDVYSEVIGLAENGPQEPIHTLTAPTGTGKTLMGIGVGLKFREIKQKNGPSKLIYCLPFTSVIDQNFDVYKKVISNSGITPDNTVLLKHHHLAEREYQKENELIIDGADLLVETWQSEIIVTTFHQFLYTLFSYRNKNLKRISALQNAVVILDEVQSIDLKYWDSIHDMLYLCAKQLNTTFLLMTATMPLIISPSDEKELLQSFHKRFDQLSRTVLHNRTETPMDLDELAAEIREKHQKDPDRSLIIILNRRKAVRELFTQLMDLETNTAMLSTDLTPLDRTRILKDLKSPFILVTTQLIEAGVDISAHEVIRDIAPLDSIIQSAGRCNRNQEADVGRVEVIKLQDNNKKLLSTWVYSHFLIKTTLEVLKDHEKVEEKTFHELATKYYHLIKDRSEQTEILDNLAKGYFNKLEGKEGLQLIKDYPKQPHFIIQTVKDEEIWNEYIEIKDMEIKSRDDFNLRRKRYQKIKREFMERIVNYPIQGQPSSEVIPIYPTSGHYDPICGLEINTNSGFDFI